MVHHGHSRDQRVRHGEVTEANERDVGTPVLVQNRDDAQRASRRSAEHRSRLAAAGQKAAHRGRGGSSRRTVRVNQLVVYEEPVVRHGLAVTRQPSCRRRHPRVVADVGDVAVPVRDQVRNGVEGGPLVVGAAPGWIMRADPKLGDSYFQEFFPGVAVDQGKVIARGLSVETELGSFDNVLKIRDTSSLEPGVGAFKFFAPGVGQVLEEEFAEDEPSLFIPPEAPPP